MTLSLPPQPNLDQLKRRARELRQAHRSGAGQALERANRFLPGAAAAVAPSLQDAQLVIAREYGFASWPRLVRHIESIGGRRPAGKLEEMAQLRSRLRAKFAPDLDQVNAALAKHGLGSVRALREVGDNVGNRTYILRLAGDEGLFLKIQCSAAEGWSLEQEAWTIRFLRQHTDLPVAERCVLDTDGDVMPHPFFFASLLPGLEGRTFFEHADPALRLEMAAILGRCIGTLFGLQVPADNPLFDMDLNNWRQRIEGALVGNGVLRWEIAALDADFFPRLDQLLAEVELPVIDGSLALIWPEADFHNMFFAPRSGGVELTGLCDFQSAGYGTPWLRKLYGEYPFRRQPAELYGDPQLPLALRRGYEEAGGQVQTFEGWHRTLFEVVAHARQVRYWWDCMGFFHPKNPQWLKVVLDGLTALKGIAA